MGGAASAEKSNAFTNPQRNCRSALGRPVCRVLSSADPGNKFDDSASSCRNFHTWNSFHDWCNFRARYSTNSISAYIFGVSKLS